MRHRVAGKNLGRTPSHRKALMRNLAAALFQYGAIRTTETKAKEVRRFAEKLITTAKKGTLHARRQIIARLRDRQMDTFDEASQVYVTEDKTLVQKLFDEIAPRYADRPGGYTRIIRVAERRIGDGGEQVILQLVEEGASRSDNAGSSSRKARAAKRYAAVGPAKKEKAASTEEVAEAPAEEVVEAAAEEQEGEESKE